MGELPTLKEELTRKSFETLENLLLQREQERISDAELDIAVNTLFSTVNGLADESFFEVISQVQTESRRRFVERRVFAHPSGDMVVFERPIGEGRVTIKANVKGEWRTVAEKDFNAETIPTLAAQNFMRYRMNMIKERGFKEV